MYEELKHQRQERERVEAGLQKTTDEKFNKAERELTLLQAEHKNLLNKIKDLEQTEKTLHSHYRYAQEEIKHCKENEATLLEDIRQLKDTLQDKKIAELKLKER